MHRLLRIECYDTSTIDAPSLRSRATGDHCGDEQEHDHAERDRGRDVPPVRHSHLGTDEDEDEPETVAEVVQPLRHPASRKYAARAQIASALEREDEERLLAHCEHGGTESTAKMTSVNSTTTSAASNGVAASC